MNIARLITIIRFLNEAREIMIDGIAVKQNFLVNNMSGMEDNYAIEYSYDNWKDGEFTIIKITELSLSNAEISFNHITCETTDGEIITMSLFGLAPLVVNIDNLQEQANITQKNISETDVSEINEKAEKINEHVKFVVNRNRVFSKEDSYKNSEKSAKNYKVVWTKDTGYSNLDKETAYKLDTKYYEYGAKYEEKIKPI